MANLTEINKILATRRGESEEARRKRLFREFEKQNQTDNRDELRSIIEADLNSWADEDHIIRSEN
jgi:hypothetical protein